jgi:hypothetical protein
MAKGWESKSVEEQQSEAMGRVQSVRQPLTPEQFAGEHKRNGLELSRQRVLQQMQTACNPNHRRMLEKALADLEAQLAGLGPSS